MDRIMVPVDGSDDSMRAVDFAVTLAKALGAELDIVSCFDLSQLEWHEGFYMNDEQLDGWQTHIKKEALHQARERVPEGVPVQTRLLRGRVTQTLLAEIRKAEPRMVVIGRKGRGALAEVLQGSTTGRLTRLSPVPVVVVN